jgi:uncharacterized protein (DUF433 family)
MTHIETRYEHIVVDEAGVPWIEDANLKVIELVLDQQAYGGTPEQLQEQHPSLTLGQIHSALAYYWDHRAELDADIERRLQQVEQLQQNSPPSPFVERLKREGWLSGRNIE